MSDLEMKHEPGHGGEKSVMHAWERFVSGDGVPEDAIRRMIEDSWMRCVDQGVNPVRHAAPIAVKNDELYGLQDRHADLIEAARPVMVQAREFLIESGTMMILTDPQGIILSVEGDPHAKDDGQAVSLVPGALWNESGGGTNAIGTALVTGTPVQISAAEHFCEGIKQWTCSASVIRDPFDESIIGILDISGLSGAHNTHCLALAVSGAGRIESRLGKMEMEKRSRLLDVTLSHGKRWGNSGMMIFDRRGRMVRANESASLFLNSKGLDLGDCSNWRVTPRRPQKNGHETDLPEWLSPDWLEPVIDRNEALGTILALPVAQSHSRIFSLEKKTHQQEQPILNEIVGDSPSIIQLKSKIQHLAQLHVPVLLLGPTGSGKELFARSLHNAGPQAKGPLVPLNCGSMTRDLLASELFGYVEGAFTGAKKGGMAGKFEAADGGTLFLDEIGEMPLDLQAHLLRVLEDGEVYRLGEHTPRKVNVRIVAATNRELRAEINAGNFRMDLFYRLAVTVLHIPALKERPHDIPRLVQHFLKLASERFNVPLKHPTIETMEILQGYSWPGNVRELRNVVEGMLLLAQGNALEVMDLPPEMLSPPIVHNSLSPPASAQGTFEANSLAENERQAILNMLVTTNGNCTRAAKKLGIAKSTLYEKMKRYAIDRDVANKMFFSR